MKVTKRERYALRMMIDLAEHTADGKPVGVRSIAARQVIAPRYLEQIANQLRKAGLVHAKQGQQGGYLLARPAETITVGEIVEAVSGPVLLLDCLADAACCERVESCRSRRMWSLVDTLMRSVLNQYHLDDLVENRLPLPPLLDQPVPSTGCSSTSSSSER